MSRPGSRWAAAPCRAACPLSLSPATIRNAMADLEEAGLLYAPHTSAGRLPTERGLRLFVDGLLEFGDLTDEEREAISARCAASGRSMQDTLAEAGQMLSGLAGAAGLVVAPSAESAVRHIEFVALGPGRALVVLVGERRAGREPRHRGAARPCRRRRWRRPATTSTPASPAARWRTPATSSPPRSRPTAPRSTR